MPLGEPEKELKVGLIWSSAITIQTLKKGDNNRDRLMESVYEQESQQLLMEASNDLQTLFNVLYSEGRYISQLGLTSLSLLHHS